MLVWHFRVAQLAGSRSWRLNCFASLCCDVSTIPLTVRSCQCGLPLASLGHCRATCAQGFWGKRALESVGRISRERSGRVTTNVLLRDLQNHDGSAIYFVPLFTKTHRRVPPACATRLRMGDKPECRSQTCATEKKNRNSRPVPNHSEATLFLELEQLRRQIEKMTAANSRYRSATLVEATLFVFPKQWLK